MEQQQHEQQPQEPQEQQQQPQEQAGIEVTPGLRVTGLKVAYKRTIPTGSYASATGEVVLYADIDPDFEGDVEDAARALFDLATAAVKEKLQPLVKQARVDADLVEKVAGKPVAR